MLSKFSVKKPLTVIVGVIIVMILGVVSYMNTGVDLLPSMNLPYIVVVTISPGSSPEEVEKTITKPVEDGLSSVANINEVISSSAEHFSMVMLEFNYEVEVDKAYSDVKAALELVPFPKDNDLLQDPIVLKINPTMLPIMRLSVSKEGESIKDSNIYLSNIIENINGIDGVANTTTNGLITNLAYININNKKIAGSLIDYIEKLLSIKVELPLIVKKDLNTGLAEAINLEDTTPEDVVDSFVEIIKNTEEWVDEDAGNGIMKVAIDLLISSLENKDSEVYKIALDRAEELIENKFILNDDEESKAIFYDFVDQISREAIVNFINNQVGALSNYLSPDLLGQLLFAQDFEMPSGSIEKGAISYIVKIGTTVDTREELLNLPIISFDAAAELSTRIDQLQTILTLASLANDGKATFTEGQLIALTEAIYQIYVSDEEPNEKGIGYATAMGLSLWMTNAMPDGIITELPNNWDTTFTNYLMEEAPSKWNRGLTANWKVDTIDLLKECFPINLTTQNIADLELLQDDVLIKNISSELAYGYVEIASRALPSSITYNLPLYWERQLKDIYVENIDVDWSRPGHSPTNDLTKQLLQVFSENMPIEWVEDLPIDWETQIQNAGNSTVIPTFSDVLKTGIEALDPKVQESLEKLFRERTQEDILNLFKGSLKLIQLFSPEGVIMPVAEEGQSIPSTAVYTIDFVLIKESIDALDEKAIIPLTLSSISDTIFLDDSTEQLTTLLTRVNGQLVATDAVSISIEKEPDKSTAEVTKRVVDFLKKTNAEDSGFNYTVLTNDGDYISFMLSNVAKNLIYGGLLAVLILLLFLRNLKATVVVGASIVISVVSTFVMMYFAGITLNIVSMGGLALGVGMLVDNSIVIIENIFRMRAQGKSIYVASIQGAKQVTAAIVASTLTTIIVFLPIAFIDGLTKQIFTDMALTISFSLIASLVVALTLVPMATSTFIKKPAKTDSKVFLVLKKGYAKSLNFALNHKVVPIVLVAILFASSILMLLNLDNELFPDSESGALTISTSIDKVAIDRYNAEKPLDDPYLTYDDVVNMIVDDIITETMKYDEIESVGISLSSGMSLAGFSLGESGISAHIMMIPEKERDYGSLELSKRIQEVLGDYNKTKGLYTITSSSNTLLGSMDLMGGDQAIKLYGKNMDMMRSEAQKIKDLLSQKEENGDIKLNTKGDPIFLEGIADVSIGNESTIEEYRIKINKLKANRYGLTVAQVFLQVQTALSEAGISHTLNLINNDDLQTDYDVYIYNTDFKVNGWYSTTDAQENEVPVYVLNNVENNEDTVYNNYFIKNTYGKSIYIKSGDINKFIIEGGNIPLIRNGNIFSYKLISEGESGIKFSQKEYTVKENGIYHKIDRVEEFDIMTYGISSANLMDPTAPTTVVPLYKLLDEESFIKDENNKIVYRENGLTFERIPVGLVTFDGYDSINRENKQRVQNINIKYDSEVNANNMSKLINTILDKDYQAPAEIRLDMSEGNKYLTETFNTLYLVLALAIVLIYLIMVAQFQSFKSPLIIMITLPLAFTGCIFALFFAKMSMSIMAMIGLIVLMGIVVNNGIVFVDYCNQMIQNNVPRRMALLRTGIDRIRPILMTALTTIFALLIMAADTSEGGSMLRPLAMAAIGGLVYSTVLTLYIVPIIFDLINKKAKQTDRTKAFLDKDIDLITSTEVEDMLGEESTNILNDIVPSNQLSEALVSINEDVEKSLFRKVKAKKEETEKMPMAFKGKKLRYQRTSKKSK